MNFHLLDETDQKIYRSIMAKKSTTNVRLLSLPDAADHEREMNSAR